MEPTNKLRQVIRFVPGISMRLPVLQQWWEEVPDTPGGEFRGAQVEYREGEGLCARGDWRDVPIIEE
jgi:hypothetical protein